MILAPVMERLTAFVAGVKVDDAVSLSEIAQAPVPVRAVYVVPADEAATGGAPTTERYEQLVDVGVDVVIVIPTGASRSGPRNEAEQLKEAVKRALIGWGHPSGRSATFYRAGRLISLAPITLVLRFVVPTRIRVPRAGAPDA